MNTIRKLSALLFSALLGATACGGPASTQGEVAPAQAARGVYGDVNLTQRDNHIAFVIFAGHTITLRLPSGGPAGCSWEVTSHDSRFDPPTSTFVPDPSDVAGAAGTEVFTWIAHISQGGRHEVQLECRRPGDAQAVDTFDFTVNIVHL